MKTMTMKAIETAFNGVRFRSRLEARWAVFMTEIGVKYHYEPEAYDLDGLFYLPDFWLPSLQAHLEIKPEEPTAEEKEKASRLAGHTGQPVFIQYGQPELSDNSSESALAFYGSGYDFHYLWCECPKCGRCELQFDGRSERISCNCNPDKSRDVNTHDSPRLLAAYSKARSFRF